MGSGHFLVERHTAVVHRAIIFMSNTDDGIARGKWPRLSTHIFLCIYICVSMCGWISGRLKWSDLLKHFDVRCSAAATTIGDKGTVREMVVLRLPGLPPNVQAIGIALSLLSAVSSQEFFSARINYDCILLVTFVLIRQSAFRVWRRPEQIIARWSKSSRSWCARIRCLCCCRSAKLPACNGSTSYRVVFSGPYLLLGYIPVEISSWGSAWRRLP